MPIRSFENSQGKEVQHQSKMKRIPPHIYCSTYPLIAERIKSSPRKRHDVDVEAFSQRKNTLLRSLLTSSCPLAGDVPSRLSEISQKLRQP